MNQSKKILVVSFQSLTAESGGGMAKLGYYLSEILHKRGLLKEFIIYSKGKHTTVFPSSPVSNWSRYILYALNKANKIFRFSPHWFRYTQELVFDYFCAKKIDSSISILFVTQPFLLRTFKKAKELGITIMFIPANPEENFINNLVTEEKEILNIDAEDAYTYVPRIKYYNKAIQFVDKVIGSYPTVYDTYLASGYKGEVVKLIGHLKPDFKPVTIAPKQVHNNTFRVGYLAHTVILKGLQYLLKAWEDINKQYPELDIELQIAGAIDESMHEYITKHYLKIKKVKLIGHIADVPKYIQQQDLFVVPSLTDGGPYTALEAAHYAVPVLITENCGSAELLGRNNPGCWVVPIRDSEALKERILYAYNNKQQTIDLGTNAKYNLDNYKMSGFIETLADYLEQQNKNING